jgi:hypothetical protein
MRRHAETKMGDRAIIEFRNNSQKNGIYLHMFGPREYVEAFIECARVCRLPDNEDGHRILCDLIRSGLADSNGTIVQYGPVDELPSTHHNNGVYVVDNWRIVDRHDDGYTAAEMAKYDRGFNRGKRKTDGLYVLSRCLITPIAQQHLLQHRLEKEMSAAQAAPAGKKRL